MIQKLYCYVDESGQDPQSAIFVVAVVVTGEERDALIDLCEQLEDASGKRKDKWGRAKHERRMRYLHYVFADGRFKDALRFKVFWEPDDYDTATIEAIAEAVKWHELDLYTSLIYVDGLSKTKRQEYGARLRQLGVSVRRVRGIRRDESNGLIRLADALAGFVRDALEGGSAEISTLFNEVVRARKFIEVK